MSCSFMPEVLRNCWYSFVLHGKACFFWSSKDFLTSASETSTSALLGLLLDPLGLDQELHDLALERSNSCLHWVFSWAGWASAAPFCTGCFCLAATHFV